MAYYRVKNMPNDPNNGRVVLGLDSIGDDHPYLERISDTDGFAEIAARRRNLKPSDLE